MNTGVLAKLLKSSYGFLSNLPAFTKYINYNDTNNPLLGKKITIPDAMQWNSVKYPIYNATLPNAGYITFKPTGEPACSLGYSVMDYVNMMHPDYLTWPVYYWDPNASTNGIGTLASPFNAGGSAIAAINASGKNGLVMCKGGSGQIAYSARNFVNNSSGTNYPTQDIIWMAYGGRLTVTTHQQFLTWVPENASAVVTASIAANSFTGSIANVTSGSTTRGILTVSSVTTGVIVRGMTLSGANVAAGTVVLKQLTGAVGGIGTYVVSIQQTAASGTITGDGGCMTVTAILDNESLDIGMISRTSAVNGCKILGFVSTNGSTGTYWVSTSSAVASTTIVFDDPGLSRTYRAEQNGVEAVVDLTTRTKEGLYPRFTYVTTKAAVRKTPNSVYIDSTSNVGYVIINRADGLVPTTSNTRVYLAKDNLYLKGTKQTSCILVGQTSNDGFDLEGGSAACLRALFTGGSNGRTVDANGIITDGIDVNPDKLIAAENCTFRYSGAYTGSGAVGNVAIEGLNGLAVFINCDASYGATDCWNFHNALGANMYALTIQCTGHYAGQIYGYISNNGWTTHDTVIAIDILGKYFGNKGVTMHAIGYTKNLLICPNANDSLGDIMNGGANQWGLTYKIEDIGSMWIYSPVMRSNIAGRTTIRAEGNGKMYLCATGDIYDTESYVVATAGLYQWSM